MLKTVVSKLLCPTCLDRKSDLTGLPLVKKKPIAFPPALIRDPLVRSSIRALQRCDDASKPAREPFILRALNRIAG